MVTAEEVTARVERLAEPFRARAKPLGPLARVISMRVLVLDVLECGHEVPAQRGSPDRRRCPFCGRST